MPQKYKKTKGYKWEDIAKKHYKKTWYQFIESNFTIRWGELDLIFQSEDKIIFIEVKVIDSIDQLQNYITQRKIQTLQKTIQTYLWKYKKDKAPRLDFVFIKNNKILEIYEDVNIW